MRRRRAAGWRGEQEPCAGRAHGLQDAARAVRPRAPTHRAFSSVAAGRVSPRFRTTFRGFRTTFNAPAALARRLTTQVEKLRGRGRTASPSPEPSGEADGPASPDVEASGRDSLEQESEALREEEALSQEPAAEGARSSRGASAASVRGAPEPAAGGEGAEVDAGRSRPTTEGSLGAPESSEGLLEAVREATEGRLSLAEAPRSASGSVTPVLMDGRLSSAEAPRSGSRSVTPVLMGGRLSSAEAPRSASEGVSPVLVEGAAGGSETFILPEDESWNGEAEDWHQS